MSEFSETVVESGTVFEDCTELANINEGPDMAALLDRIRTCETRKEEVERLYLLEKLANRARVFIEAKMKSVSI